MAQPNVTRAGRRRSVAGRHRRGGGRAGAQASRADRGDAPDRRPRPRALVHRRHPDGAGPERASTSSARWTPTCRTTRAACRRSSPPPSDADIVIGSRYVPGGAIVNWPRRRRMLSRFANIVHPPRDAAERARLHQRLPLLAARRARRDPARALHLGGLLVSRRDAVRRGRRGACGSRKCRSPSSNAGWANRS